MEEKKGRQKIPEITAGNISEQERNVSSCSKEGVQTKRDHKEVQFSQIHHNGHLVLGFLVKIPLKLILQMLLELFRPLDERVVVSLAGIGHVGEKPPQAVNEEVVVRDDVREEVLRDELDLKVQHGHKVNEEARVVADGLLAATNDVDEALPPLEPVVDLPDEEADEGELELAQHCVPSEKVTKGSVGGS